MRVRIPMLGLWLAGFCSSSVLGFQPTPEPISSPRYQRFIDDLFAKYDQDGDGFIQDSEHEHVHYPLLQQADADGDGQVSRGEVLAVVAPTAGRPQNKTAAAQQLAKLLGGRKGNVLGGNLGNLMSGGNSGLLGGAMTFDKKNAETSLKPASVSIAFVALELPDDFAKQEIVTLKEMTAAVAEGQMDESQLEKNGVRLLDLFEFSCGDGKESRLTVGRSRMIKEHVNNRRVSNARLDLGSTLRVTPRIQDQAILVDLDYQSTAGNQNDMGARQIGTQTRLVFDDSSSTKLVNLYNDGVHYLLIVSATTR